MDPLYTLIAYFHMPRRTLQDLRSSPVDPLALRAPSLVGTVEHDVIPATVRRSAGNGITPQEGIYVIDRPPRNTGHRG